MMHQEFKTLIVVPAFNEEGKIGDVVKKTVLENIGDILVIDDGSDDNTPDEARESGAIVLSHKERKGVGAAIRTGIDYALKNGYEIIGVMAGDDQDNPSEFKILLDKILEGYDFVQGSRYIGGERTKDIPLFRKLTTKLYALIFKLFTGFPCTDGTNGFRAFRSSIFNNKKINLWQDWLNTYELEPYLFYQVVKLGFKVIEVPVTKTYNIKKGYSKMKIFKDWWRILRPLVFLRLGIKS